MINGYHMSPHDTQIVIDNIGTLDQRLRTASITTMSVIMELSNKGWNVTHPMLPNHPTHQRAQSMLKFPPPIFTVTTTCLDKDKIFRIFQTIVPDISIKTSYSGLDSHLCNYPHKVHGNQDLMRL